MIVVVLILCIRLHNNVQVMLVATYSVVKHANSQLLAFDFIDSQP